MRWIIVGGILALVVTVYALVDLTVTDDRRIRRLNRVLWIVLIVVLPILGPLGWLVWGKAPRSAFRPAAPDDDPSFSRSSTVTDEEADRRIAELEAQLAALDDELDPELDAEIRPAGVRPEHPNAPAADVPGRDDRAGTADDAATDDDTGTEAGDGAGTEAGDDRTRRSPDDGDAPRG